MSKVGTSTKGNTFIHCPSPEIRDKFEAHLTDVPNQTVHAIKDKLPTISITGITQPIEKENVLTEIGKQNPHIQELLDQNHTFKIMFVNKPRGVYKHYQVVAYVSPEIRDIIGKHGNRLYIGLESVRVYDRFYVKRCNRCNLFGHYQEGCDKTLSCGLCGVQSDHETQNCGYNESTTMDQFQCINCVRAGLVGTGHGTSWPKCPAYVIAQRKLRSQIPYYEGLK